jgi:hypothetical protein
MADEPTGAPQQIAVEKSPDFAMHASDGSIIVVLTKPESATAQLIFWSEEPDVGALEAAASRVQTGQVIQGTNIIRRLQVGVRMTPDSAMQLAVAIIENIARLPDNIKAMYKLQNIQIQRHPS